MHKFSIALHGGAKADSEYIRSHHKEYKLGLQEALHKGADILKKGGKALDAVEASTIELENNPLFNAGRGSALNEEGNVEMDAAIMDGQKIKAGAVSIVTEVKNPITLARFILAKTTHVLLSGKAALKLAKNEHIQLAPISYFITDHQVNEFKKNVNNAKLQNSLEKKIHGTVGVVALDTHGNLASAVSTGGTELSLPGRVGDSCIIGAGCYANNKTCAVATTGKGESLIIAVLAYTVSILVEFKNLSIKDACKIAIHERYKEFGDMGVIAIDINGNIGMSCNTSVFMRASLSNQKESIHIYA